jgi:hypothetical protein
MNKYIIEKKPSINKYKYIKIWIIVVTIVTIIFLIYNQFCDNSDMPVYDIDKINYLRTHTPAYPPPLINFID